MYKKGITIEAIIQAVNDSNGFLTFAAEKLGCSYQNIWQRAKKNPELKEAIEAIGEHHLDVAENKLVEAIEKGEAWAICFFLKCKGKKRSYIERQEFAGVQDAPIRINIAPALTQAEEEKQFTQAFANVMERNEVAKNGIKNGGENNNGDD